MDTHDDSLPHPARDESAPEAAGGGEQPQAHPARAGSASGPWGSEPSNTDPQNYTPLNLKALRTGLDSLYLSARGKLFENWFQQLTTLKEKAQSADLAERAKAQVSIGGHVFEVKDRGSRFYAFILEDNAFHIQLGKGEMVPLAYVQVRAEYLAHATLEAILDDLRLVLNTFAKRQGDLVVSRADLCTDFVPPCPMDSWPVRAWVTRARDIKPHFRHQKLTGWSIGAGGAMSARLYNKLLEIMEKSLAVHFFELWTAKGWVDGEDVWRIEAQFRRDVLEQLGIRSPEDLASKLRALWCYFTEDWLRLTLPNNSDRNPTRWPYHPLWSALSAVSWDQEDQPRLKRFRNQRIPGDDKIFPAAMGYLASFMAREGIEDFGEALGEFLRQMRGYMDIEGGHAGKSFEDMLDERRLAKGRLYNTLDNTRLTPEELATEAESYRRGKDGEDADL